MGSEPWNHGLESRNPVHDERPDPKLPTWDQTPLPDYFFRAELTSS